MNTSPRQDNAHSLADANGENRRRYKGIRMRKWGKWVSEVRMPKSRAKIWLGSYDNAEQAARAYDAAVYCLRGLNGKFNFPNLIPAIPSASSLSIQQIQLAAAKYALGEMPSFSNNNNNNNSVLTEETPSTLRSSSVSGLDASSNGQTISEDQECSLCESLLGDFEGNRLLDLGRLLANAETLDLTSPTEEGNIFFHPADLWN